VSFYEDHDDEIVTAITDKFGRPKRTDVPRQNGFGARWSDSIFEWRRAGDELVLVHLGQRAPTPFSIVTLSSASYLKRQAEAGKAEQAKRSKDL
jgi:hypothetical protein